jgi:hypothetical protein
MARWICVQCGTMFPESGSPPSTCLICADERQYVRHGGQQWTTVDRLIAEGYRNAWSSLEPDLFGIQTVPAFAIGQQMLLVRTAAGLVVWDPISLVDPVTVALLRALGGVAAITASHPHFYAGMVAWAEAFDAAVYVHEANRPWVVDPSPRIRYFAEDAFPLPGGLTNSPGGASPGLQAWG